LSNAPFVTGRIAPLSVLELATVQEGQSAEAGLAAVTAVARRADELGLRRMWLAEHHGFRSVGSVAPAVLTAHLAANTSRIRLGSGGVLLTHHAPLVVAEQFATLSALYPGRIDLGVGRGPGTKDERVLRALRNTSDAAAQNFDAALEELLDLLTDDAPHRVLPGTGNTHPEPWLLSTSITGARLAARLGLPLAVGHHINPRNTIAAITDYREQFSPSKWRDDPYVMVSVETLCAPTDAEAAELGRPAALTMAMALQGNGADAPLQPPAQAALQTLSAELADRLATMRATQAHGSAATVATRLAQLTAETAADELILTTPVYDPAARIRSLELTAGAAASTNS
jgi:luciferase family oxidoreductase group 1